MLVTAVCGENIFWVAGDFLVLVTLLDITHFSLQSVIISVQYQSNSPQHPITWQCLLGVSGNMWSAEQGAGRLSSPECVGSSCQPPSLSWTHSAHWSLCWAAWCPRHCPELSESDNTQQTEYEDSCQSYLLCYGHHLYVQAQIRAANCGNTSDKPDFLFFHVL